MAVLEPMADGFRNYKKTDYTLSSEQLLIDKAQLLTLSAPEMTVLLGGMRVLNANFDQSNLGVLTETPGVLNNAFFMNLCSMDYEWKPKTEAAEEFDGFLRGTNEVKWSASRADLIFDPIQNLEQFVKFMPATMQMKNSLQTLHQHGVRL